MRKNRILYFIVLITSIFAISCDDNRDVNLVDDKIYLLESGLNEFNAELGESFEYNLYVIKSGVGIKETNLQLAVNESILTEYNADNETDLVLLPSQYYQIVSADKQVKSDDYRMSFEILFDTNAILELQSGSEQIYVLPCEVKIIGSPIETGGSGSMKTLLSPVVVEPVTDLSL